MPFADKVFFEIQLTKLTATKNTVAVCPPIIYAMVVISAQVNLVKQQVIMYICPPELSSVVPISWMDQLLSPVGQC